MLEDTTNKIKVIARVAYRFWDEESFLPGIRVDFPVFPDELPISRVLQSESKPWRAARNPDPCGARGGHGALRRQRSGNQPTIGW